MSKTFSIMATSVICIVLMLGASLRAAAQALSEPEKLFEQLWKTYDRNYALFGAKHLDWDALYKVYRPRVTAKTTEDELFQVIADLLGNLNDNHVRVTSPTRQFQSGILGQIKMEDFSLDLVKQKYLKDKFTPLVDGLFHYGWLTDSIGYFHFRGFGRMDATRAAIDRIVGEFKDAKAIVVDVRGNGGGDDRVGKLIADRFADRKRLYMKTQIRSGARHDDFTPWKYWYVEPDGPVRFTRPVILLTHRHSVSAAENFALAMRVLPNVTVVGDATSGVFADVYGDRLPNGWRFSVSFKLFVDCNDFCWEGIGVPSDIRETNTKQDIEQQRDRVLNLALALIEGGGLRSREEPASLRDIRDSLAKNLGRDVKAKGLAAALDAYRAAKRGPASRYYVDLEELREVGEDLWRDGKRQEAVAVFKIAVDESPWAYDAHERLGYAHLDRGDPARAMPLFKKSAELNRRSYPWEVTSYDDAVRLGKGTRLLARELEREIEAKGIDAALKAFDQAKQGAQATYYVDETKVNQLGYQLMNRDKTMEAIEVFKLNVREFPKSSNVYDSLGEGYAKAGNKELAIQNYKRSLELDPKNANAEAWIKRLSSDSGSVDDKALDDYAGRYDSPLGLIVITREGNRLFGAPAGQNKLELIPRSGGRFEVTSVGIQVEFVRDDRGQVTKMLIIQGGERTEAKKATQ